MKKLKYLLAGWLVLSGCAAGNANQAAAIHQGDYAAILPYDTSYTRGKHVGLITSVDIRNQMEIGLMDLSKEYFNPMEVGYKSHVYLDYDELDATDMSRGLLGTLRDDNPNGLNPGADEAFDTGNGVVNGPVLVLDLYELDFYKNNALSGISLALVVTDTVEINGEKVEIEPDKMKDYLDVTSTKLVNYMRERFNEITNRVPILVAAYQINTDATDASNGGYIYSVFFNGASTDYKTIQEEHYIVPGQKFSTADPEMASEFNQFRESIRTILSDATFVTGEARYNDGVCSKMTLDITTHGKTAGEILAAVQAVREDMSVFTSENTDFRVIIKNDNNTVAIMRRAPESRTVEILSML